MASIVAKSNVKSTPFFQKNTVLIYNLYFLHLFLCRHDYNLFVFQNGARGIHTAAMKGHVSVINTLLAKGENVDAATNVIINMLFRILYIHIILQ